MKTMMATLYSFGSDITRCIQLRCCPFVHWLNKLRRKQTYVHRSFV